MPNKASPPSSRAAWLDPAKQAHKKAGGELKAFYLTIGQYDAVAIADLPDDATLARIALSLGAPGKCADGDFAPVQ
jgi:uncharacterized protein with GYD domain